MELELLELFSLVLPFLFDRLREATGLIPDGDEVTVLGVIGDGNCKLVRLEVFEAVVAEFALLSLLDGVRINDVKRIEVRIVQFESMTVIDMDSEAVVVIAKRAFLSKLNRS